MCTLCNFSRPDIMGLRFLSTFDASKTAMKATTEAMLACAETALTPEQQARYQGMHDRMVRLAEEWSRLEVDHAAAPPRRVFKAAD